MLCVDADCVDQFFCTFSERCIFRGVLGDESYECLLLVLCGGVGGIGF